MRGGLIRGRTPEEQQDVTDALDQLARHALRQLSGQRVTLYDTIGVDAHLHEGPTGEAGADVSEGGLGEFRGREADGRLEVMSGGTECPTFLGSKRHATPRGASRHRPLYTSRDPATICCALRISRRGARDGQFTRNENVPTR